MANCTSCGAVLTEDQKFCSACGKPVDPAASRQQPDPSQQNAAQAPQQPGVDLSATVKNMMQMPDETDKHDSADIEENKLIALLSYLSVLVLIPLFAIKNSPFVRFHTNQGLVLFLVSMATGLVGYLLGLIPFAGVIFGFLFGLIRLGLLALSVLGIVNCVKGKAKRLPIFGSIFLIK